MQIKLKGRREDNIKIDVICGPDSNGEGQDPMASSCENGDEHFGSIKGGQYLDQLRNYQFLKEKSAP
jgi:hypothetical protein